MAERGAAHLRYYQFLRRAVDALLGDPLERQTYRQSVSPPLDFEHTLAYVRTLSDAALQQWLEHGGTDWRRLPAPPTCDHPVCAFGWFVMYAGYCAVPPAERARHWVARALTARLARPHCPAWVRLDALDTAPVAAPRPLRPLLRQVLWDL